MVAHLWEVLRTLLPKLAGGATIPSSGECVTGSTIATFENIIFTSAILPWASQGSHRGACGSVSITRTNPVTSVGVASRPFECAAMFLPACAASRLGTHRGCVLGALLSPTMSHATSPSIRTFYIAQSSIGALKFVNMTRISPPWAFIRSIACAWPIGGTALIRATTMITTPTLLEVTHRGITVGALLASAPAKAAVPTFRLRIAARIIITYQFQWIP